MTGKADASNIMQQAQSQFLEKEECSSDSSESSSSDKDDDLSDDESFDHENATITLDSSKSNGKDNEERLMREMMSFRKDELQIEDDSQDSEDSQDDRVKMIGIEEAGEMVEEVESEIMNYSDAIKEMDKKMSYNLRLITSMIYNQPEKEGVEASNLRKQKTLYQKQ